MIKKLILIAGIIIFTVVCYKVINPETFIPEQSATEDEKENPKPEEQDPIQEKIDQMTLDEKIGQMMITGIPGTTVDQPTLDLIHKYHVGGLIFFDDNLKNSSQVQSLLNDIKEENKSNPLPLLLGVDQEGGRVERLPNVKQMPPSQRVGEINDPDFSFDIGKMLGNELNEFGFNIDFAPVLDINNNPDNIVIGDRSFGSTEKLVSLHGIQVMKGLQSEEIIPVIKHFPGHGDTGTDSHLELPVIRKSLEELKGLELIPFKKAIDEGADMVMTAHILLPKVDDKNPATLSKTIITDVLRTQLGFDGVIVTDDMTMDAIDKYFEIGNAAVESIQAGTDLIMVAQEHEQAVDTFQAIKEAVNSGEIPEERINESVRRIIELKQKYQLNHKPVERANVEELNESIEKLLSKY